MPDLERLRTDLGYFAHSIGAPLADWQIQDLELDSTIVCLLWARQLGKSRTLAIDALHMVSAAPGRRALIVSGGGDVGAQRLLDEARSIMQGSPLFRGSAIDETSHVLRLANGGEIRCVPASEAAARGWQVDRLYIDEAQLVGERLIAAVLPTISAAENGRALLAGTASVASGPFFDLFRRGEVGDAHVRSSRRVSSFVGGPDPAPWQNASVIQAQMETMGALVADAEHRCIWASSADAFITRARLERCIADFAMTPLPSLRGPAKLTAGVDWGATTDRSALVATGRLPIPAFGVITAQRWPAAYPLDDVIAEIAGSGAYFDTITAESNGLGEACAQSLVKALRRRPPAAGGGLPQSLPILLPAHKLADVEDYGVPAPWRHVAARPQAGFVSRKLKVHVDQRSKAVMYSSLRLLLDRRQLWISSSAEQLIRELLLLKVDLSLAGLERVEGVSDDLCDALALALCPVKGKNGWTTYIGELAERLPPLEGEPEIPPVPAWQSVAGTGETTTPEGAVQTDPHAELRARASEALKRIREEATSG